MSDKSKGHYIQQTGGCQFNNPEFSTNTDECCFQAMDNMPSGQSCTGQDIATQVTYTVFGLTEFEPVTECHTSGTATFSTNSFEVNREVTHSDIHIRTTSNSEQHPHVDSQLCTYNSQIQSIDSAVNTENNPVVQTECGNIEEALQQMHTVNEQSIKRHNHCYSRAEYQEMQKAYNEVVEDVNRDRERLQKENTTLRKELREAKDKTEEMMKELHDMSHRLSAEMSTKVSTNETTLENISIRNRPMTIRDDYSNLCLQHWHEAKVFLDNRTGLNEKYKLQVLCNIMKISAEAAECKQLEVNSKLHSILHDPLGAITSQTTTEHIHDNTGRNSQESHPLNTDSKKVSFTADQHFTKDDLSVASKNSLGDHFRNNSDAVDLSPLIQVINEGIADNDLLACEEIKVYIENVAKLSWKMVNQRPMMNFIIPAEGQKFHDNTMDIHYGSICGSDFMNSAVECCVFPALHHGDNMMSKAKVLLGPGRATDYKQSTV